MPLIDCIRAAGNTSAGMASEFGGVQLDALKEQLWLRISSDALARLAAENPARAENEIRSICRQIFVQDVLPNASSLDEPERESLVNALLDALFGFGPLEEMLADPEVTEIMVNGTHSIYCEKHGKLYRSEKAIHTDEEVGALIDRIIGPIGRRIDESCPMVNARLPEGHRVHAIIPPLALDGPVLTIRKFTAHVITLEEMVSLGSIEESMVAFLCWAVAARTSMAVSGGTGTGKTTFLNALSCKISSQERILTIEDSAELRFLEHPHVVRLESRPPNAEGMGQVSIRDLVINALRMRPDRIIVGECRGPEALDMLQAMNTGHDGSLTTLHANSPADAISRLTVMVRYAADLPIDVIERQAASAIDLILQLARGSCGDRYLSQIVALSYDEEAQRVKVLPLYQREYFDEPGTWIALPDWMETLERKGIATDGEVRGWKQEIGMPALPS
ncbi:MAG: CpaF family protein [Eggerthellaceae bacterium]|jgi:pilus assembly protein CpaF